MRGVSGLCAIDGGKLAFKPVSELTPEEPHEAGVPERLADQSHEEGARILADEARDKLSDRGFTDDQIREWAETYIAEEGSGDVDAFVEWIARREHGNG
jgi:hypothetical protein